MEKLKYTVIKDQIQYDAYCNLLEDLLLADKKELQDEVDLLTFLIEKWDNDNNSFKDSDPIEVLKYLMNENHLKAVDLVDILELSKGTVSKIINYQKGISKDSIRKLSDYFKVSQEVFNRPYSLKNSPAQRARKEALKKTI